MLILQITNFDSSSWHWPPPAAARPLAALALSQQLLRLRTRCRYGNLWSQGKPTVQQLLPMDLSWLWRLWAMGQNNTEISW